MFTWPWSMIKIQANVSAQNYSTDSQLRGDLTVKTVPLLATDKLTSPSTSSMSLFTIYLHSTVLSMFFYTHCVCVCVCVCVCARFIVQHEESWVNYTWSIYFPFCLIKCAHHDLNKKMCLWNTMPPTICLPLKIIEATSKFYGICPKFERVMYAWDTICMPDGILYAWCEFSSYFVHKVAIKIPESEKGDNSVKYLQNFAKI